MASARLTAVASGGSKQPAAPIRGANNIGTLRLFAAMLVLFGHSYVLSHPGLDDPISDHLSSLLPLGRGLSGQGVAIFFVISGYLVTQSFLRRGDLARFAEARALRIFPALWVAVLLTVFMGALITVDPALDFLRSKTTLGYIAHNFSLINFQEGLRGIFQQNPASDANISLWTLPLELGMYGVVAMVGTIGLIRRPALFNVAIVALFVAYFATDQRLPIVGEHHPSELILYFATGAALLVNAVKPRGDHALGLTAAASLAALLDAPGATVLIVLAFSYGVLWIGFSDRIRLPDLAAKGDLSYGTYLYACPVTQLWIAAVGPSAPFAIFLLTAATTLPIAYLSWRVVERPALAQKGRIVDALSRLRPRFATD